MQFPVHCPKVLVKSEDQQSGLVCSINELLARMFSPMKISEKIVSWKILGMYTYLEKAQASILITNNPPH